MKRPSNYNTKHSKAILAYLASAKDSYLTAAQISEHLQSQDNGISRPTIYRQLEKLVGEGNVNKVLISGISGFCYQYVDKNNNKQDGFYLKCEVCNEIINMECDEINYFSRHIYQEHHFWVNDKKIVLYGKCEICLQK